MAKDLSGRRLDSADCTQRAAVMWVTSIPPFHPLPVKHNLRDEYGTGRTVIFTTTYQKASDTTLVLG